MSLQLPLVSGEGPSPTDSFLVKGIRYFIYPNREALGAPEEGGPVECAINGVWENHVRSPEASRGRRISIGDGRRQ